MNRSLTAKQIAARLGISQPTVSRALSDTQAHLVAPETRERVLEIARQLGYRPNASARSLRNRRTNIVGFYSGYGYLAPSDEFLTQMIGGLQRACDRHQLDLLLHGVYRGRSTDDIFAELMNGRIDGLFVHTSSDDPLAARLATAAVPVVAVADRLPEIPSVGCDDEQGMELLLQYLQERGYRRMIFAAPETQMASVESRIAAFERFVARNATGPVVVRADFSDADTPLSQIADGSGVRTAICAWNDMYAYNLLRACRQRGIMVPEQVGITGFDGFLDHKFPAAQLTTVVAPWAEVADCACEMLIEQIQGKTVPLQKVLPVILHPGDTV